jgi:hypothetical protein
MTALTLGVNCSTFSSQCIASKCGSGRRPLKVCGFHALFSSKLDELVLRFPFCRNSQVHH